MDKFIQNCFIARVCRAFSRAFPESFLGKIHDFFSRKYRDSATRRLFVGFFSVSPKIVYSKFYACLLKFNSALKRFGDAVVSPALSSSFIVKLIKKLFDSSFILTTLKNFGMRRILLVLFALFLPLDYLIRDVMKLDALASIWDEGFLIFCVLFILWRIMVSKDLIKPRISPLDTAIFFFMCVGLLLLAVVSPKIKPAIDGYRAVCQFMLWFYVVIRLIENDGDFKAMYYSLCALAVIVALHGIYQYITKAPIPAHWVSQAEMGVRTRAYSIFGSPNVMGAFLVMTAPMLAACVYYAKSLWAKCLLWGAVGILCLSTLVTFSRGAWFGLTIAVVVFSLLVDRKLLLIAALAIVAVIFCVPEISNRITFLFSADFVKASSTGGRSERWDIGIQLWRRNRLFGFGLGRYGGAIAMQNQEIDDILYYYMDNYYLKTLTEMGLIGLVSYVWLLLRNLLWSCRSLFKTQKNKMSVLSAGIVAGQLGVLAHSFFENIFEVPYMNAYFWGLSALVMYLGYTRRRKNDKA